MTQSHSCQLVDRKQPPASSQTCYSAGLAVVKQLGLPVHPSMLDDQVAGQLSNNISMAARRRTRFRTYAEDRCSHHRVTHQIVDHFGSGSEATAESKHLWDLNLPSEVLVASRVLLAAFACDTSKHEARTQTGPGGRCEYGAGAGNSFLPAACGAVCSRQLTQACHLSHFSL